MTGRNDHELWLAYEEQGSKAAKNREEAMALARLLRGHEAYADPKDVRHATVKRDLKALYEGHVPNVPEVELVHINGRLVVPGANAQAQLGNPRATPKAALTARWNAGASPQSFSAPDRVALRQMMVAQPAYRDANHPEHAAFVHDAATLYALDAPRGE